MSGWGHFSRDYSNLFLNLKAFYEFTTPELLFLVPSLPFCLCWEWFEELQGWSWISVLLWELSLVGQVEFGACQGWVVLGCPDHGSGHWGSPTARDEVPYKFIIFSSSLKPTLSWSRSFLGMPWGWCWGSSSVGAWQLPGLSQPHPKLF